MSFSEFRPSFEWIMKTYIKRGYDNIYALCTCVVFFYYVPRLMLLLCSFFPDMNLYNLYVFGTILIHLFGYLLANSIFALFYYIKHPKIEA